MIAVEWTFESYGTTANTVSPTFTANPPEVNNSGTTTPVLTGNHATATGTTTYSEPSGNGSARALSVNNWAVGDYWQFDVGAGFSGLQVEFDQISSSTGPSSFNLQDSINGGGFNTVSNYAVLASTSVSFSNSSAKSDTPPRYLFDFTGNTAVETASDVTFRLAAVTVGPATGTDRIDNVTVGTTLTPPTVPEPASLGTVALGVATLLGRRHLAR